MWLDIILLVGGLYLLIKGSDIFVESSVKIAKALKVSEILIGMTLVCFGTSLPELFVSVNGSIKGTADLVVANMVGSNMFNICMILGAISIIHPIRLLKATVRKDMYMSLATGAVYLLLIMDIWANGTMQNTISTTDGLVFIVMFIIFMYYNLYHFKDIAVETRNRRILKKKQALNKITKQEKEKVSKKQKRDFIEMCLVCILGAGLVYIGSECVLNGAVGLVARLGVSQMLIAILLISVGTSLPELVTSISALKKGRVNVAIGNLIGSNMYNMLFVTGAAAVARPLSVTMPTIWVDCIFFIVIALILIVFTKIRYINKGTYEMSRLEGIILVIIYILYITYAVVRG